MNDQYFVLGGGTGAATMTSGMSYTFSTPAGVQAGVNIRQVRKEIGATLYLKFVKSKLGKVQVERAKKRLAKLQKLISYSKEMGQRALYEALCEEVAVLVREAEMVAFGVNTWIDFKDIDKFRGMVKDKVIRWEPLEKFPRVVPKKVQTQIKQLEKAKVFDEFHILFIDYTKQEIKTTKEKIRNKDPILFGRFTHQPNRFYYIADWVDEYCDLTLDKFVTKFKDEDPDYGVNHVEDITEDRWKGIVDEVKARHKSLVETTVQNWREKERDAIITEHVDSVAQQFKELDAEKAKTKPATNEPEVLKPWWKVW